MFEEAGYGRPSTNGSERDINPTQSYIVNRE